jgi:hypothetical protein
MVCPSLDLILYTLNDVCSGRGQWYAKFRAALGKTKDVEEVEKLLMGRLRRWMGLSPLKVDQGDVAELGVSADPDQGESESE